MVEAPKHELNVDAAHRGDLMADVALDYAGSLDATDTT